MSLADASRVVRKETNQVGNIIVDSEDCHMVLEAEGNFINIIPFTQG